MIQRSGLTFLIVSLSERLALDEADSSSWHLFNDFLVRKVSKEEALLFSSSWKMPSILTFQVSTARHSVDDSWKDRLDTMLLYHDWSIK